jgi:hypothetical protein
VVYIMNMVTDIGGSIKGGEFSNNLFDYQLLKKDSNPWR